MEKDIFTNIFQTENLQYTYKDSRIFINIPKNEAEISSLSQQEIQRISSQVVEELGISASKRSLKNEGQTAKKLLSTNLKLDPELFARINKGDKEVINYLKRIFVIIASKKKEKQWSVYDLVEMGFVSFDLELKLPFANYESVGGYVIMLEVFQN